jgi:HSP20 family protein
MEVPIMTLMRRTNPFGEFLSLRQAMDRLFEESIIRPRTFFAGDTESGFGIPLDVSSTPDSLIIEASLPGVKPEDVEITVMGDTLTINASSGEEQEREESGYMYREVRRGRFSRTVTLPAQVNSDKAVASFENGMLRLSIPKAEEAKPRQIRIGTTAEAKPVGAGSTQQTQARSQEAASLESAASAPRTPVETGASGPSGS